MKLLRAYFEEKEKHRERPPFEYLTRLACEEGMKGVTVFKGVLGFGKKDMYIEVVSFRYPQISYSGGDLRHG